MYQIIEVIVLAAIAFLIISNLISSVGTVDEDDKFLNKKHTNNSGSIKDVTNTILNSAKEETESSGFNYEEIKKYFSSSLTKEEVLNINSTLGSEEINISPEKFLKSAESAFRMIVNEIRNPDANLNNNNEVLLNLIDKRYINQFISSIDSGKYKKFDLQNIKCLISDSYSFSRSVFVSVSFISNDELLSEEWTFQKSPHSQSNIWVLSNINVLS